MIPPALASLWVYLSASPLLWLTATLAAYAVGDRVAHAMRRHPAVNPVLVAVILLVGMLWATDTPYATFFAGAQFVHFLLGPATVALAIPLIREFPRVWSAAVPLLGALIVGSAVAIVSVVGIAAAFGASPATVLSLAPKSATSPIAMAIAERIGGLPTLTAVMGVLTGICGAMVVTPLMNALGFTDFAARGFAVGVAAGGIGTARAFQVSELAGTFAGLGLALNGVATSVLTPLLLPVLLDVAGYLRAG